MSLSSLEAQLAAIQKGAGSGGSAAAAAGSFVPASKRHEDAAGRGLAHSVQTGHGSAAVVASVLYPTAAAAADVPLHTVKEECETAWYELTSELAAPASLMNVWTALENNNDKKQQAKLLRGVTVYLSSCLGEGSTDIQQRCLSVTEYLIRKYHIHAGSTLAADFLWMWLPHASNKAAVWHRAVQLLDTATMAGQAYIWLRPYAAASGQQVPPVPLTARHVLQDSGILRTVCRWTAEVAALQIFETENDYSDGELAAPRRGIARLLSYSAAIMVQGLSWLASTTDQSKQQQHWPAVVRILLPTLVTAVQSRNTDFVSWGYVVASVLAETCPLAPTTVTTLVVPMLHACQTATDLATAADGIAAALSILMPPHMTTVPAPTKKDSSSASNMETFLKLSNGKWLGCPLTDGVWRALCAWDSDSLAAALGHLHANRHVYVAPVVVALFAAALQKDHAQLCLDLLGEGALQTLYEDPRVDLVASLAAEIVRMSLQVDDSVDTDDDESFETGRAILKALHLTGTMACERGMADAIQQNPVTKAQKQRLTRLMEGIVAPATVESSEQDIAVGQLLPPRVALEHADASVRLQAVQRLVSLSSQDMMDVGTSDSESLVESMLRRWSMDDDAKVALAACSAVCGMWSTVVVNEDNYCELAELTLSGSYRWIQAESRDLSKKSVMLAALVAKTISQISERGASTLWQLLVEVVAAQLGQDDEGGAEGAAAALLVALDTKRTPKKKKTSAVPMARKALSGSEPFIKGIQQFYSHTRGIDSRAEMAIRGRCLWVLMESIAEHFDKDCKASEYDTIALCLLVLNSADSSLLDASKCELLKKCLDQSIAQVLVSGTGISSVLASLASVGPDTSFTKVARPVIHQLSEKVPTKAGPPALALTVLMEVALRVDTSSVAVERLVALASNIVSSLEGTSAGLAIVPALALLESVEERVRIASVELLKRIESSLDSRGDTDCKPLIEVCRGISNHTSSASLGGSSFLSAFMSSCISESQSATKMRESLLKLCVFSATSCSADVKTPVSKALESRWLELNQASGGCQAASILLHALDFAGEDSFPLALRWKLAGQPLVEQILNANPTETEISASFLSLSEAVVRMLKGVTISDPRIIISSGPRSGGGRARSYSVGKFDGVKVINPYPKEMHSMLVDVLTLKEDTSGTRLLAALVARDVLASKSWGEGIYQNLSRPVRKRVAAAIIDYISGDLADPPEGVFSGLPFDSIDITELLTLDKSNAQDLASVSILTDFIRSNIERLLTSGGVNGLVTELFDLLANLSAEKSDDVDGVDFTCQSILLALSQLLGRAEAASVEIKVEKKKLTAWVSLLLALLGNLDQEPFKSTRPLPTYRARAAVLSLLARLCKNYPDRVVASLLPAMSTCISIVSTQGQAAMNVKDAFSILVPVYCSHAPSAGLSMATLLSSFVGSVRLLTDEHTKRSTFQAMIEVLSVDQEAAAGAVVAAFIAGEVFTMGKETDVSESVSSAVQILSYCPASTQAAALLLLLRYAKAFLLHLQGEVNASETEGHFLPSPFDILKIALKGPSFFSSKLDSSLNAKSRLAVTTLTQSLFRTFNEALILDSIRRFVRKSEGSASSVCLRLWQNLLVVQSTAQGMTGGESASDETIFWKSVTDALNESREYLQELLPAHIFLASVTSLIKEGGTDEIRSRALKLVSDRAIEVDPLSPEASLFIDLVPDMIELLKPTSSDDMSDEDGPRSILLQQSVLVAVEHIARGLGVARPTNGRSIAAASSHFFKALELSAALLLDEYQKVKGTVSSDFSSLDNNLCQLFCSIALCAATLVRVTGARCLPVLPKMMGTFIDLLSSTNRFVSSFSGDDTDALSQASVLQLSLMRVFLAIAESVPQFLGSYLTSLLIELAILSKCLSLVPKDQSDPSLKVAAERLEAALPSRVPSRLFLPATSKAVAKCLTPVEAATMLAMLKVSIQASTSAEATGQKNMILQAVTKAFDFEGTVSERSMLLETGNKVLVALILKLSEVQLRGLYMSLREWRGDFDKSNPEHHAKRRFAFWTVSAALGKELRSIFLPCLSMVISDVISELELAASSLCRPQVAEKLAGGNKKRRLASSEVEKVDYGPDSLETVEPLLRCLENSLRADAHDGGKWVRSDESQRYNALLEPLGKLLQSRIPTDASTENTRTTAISFQNLVQGATQDSGSVVTCLTALALAAGNEQLWKPLNHAVLEACANEHRAEVRMAGITSLLSLCKSLGEEYMVLLPECLPVLSELLEDGDEDICALAKECVTLAEELIGESLEDSLR